jgi:glycosyltransferase involved in cell wall biosynthesis
MIRLHLPAIPHTITTNEYSHCAFTGKVLRFCAMMKKRGFEVYHYGIETSTVDATKNIELLSKKKWEKLRIESYLFLHPELKIEEVKEKLNNNANFIGDLGNYTTPLYKEFNRKLKLHLSMHYRSTATDIVCLPFGRSYDEAIQDMKLVVIESGIGYPDSYQNYRIFESYSQLHTTLAIETKCCQHYWFVVPNYYNILEWPLNLNPDKKKVGFFGRICDIKGCNIILDISYKFPHIDFIICGQGDPTPYINNSSNIKYKPPIHGLERGEFLSSLTVLLAPTIFIEPFGGVAVEAQLCGTPVITNDCGAFVETVEPFKTGVFCHTLADFCKGVQMALDDKFDRQYIHDRAKRLYDMDVIGKKYEYVFKTLLDIHNGNNGWYSTNTYLELLN